MLVLNLFGIQNSKLQYWFNEFNLYICLMFLQQKNTQKKGENMFPLYMHGIF